MKFSIFNLLGDDKNTAWIIESSVVESLTAVGEWNHFNEEDHMLIDFYFLCINFFFRSSLSTDLLIESDERFCLDAWTRLDRESYQN